MTINNQLINILIFSNTIILTIYSFLKYLFFMHNLLTCYIPAYVNNLYFCYEYELRMILCENIEKWRKQETKINSSSAAALKKLCTNRKQIFIHDLKCCRLTIFSHLIYSSWHFMIEGGEASRYPQDFTSTSRKNLKLILIVG